MIKNYQKTVKLFLIGAEKITNTRWNRWRESKALAPLTDFFGIMKGRKYKEVKHENF